jgi:hypothetical protein
MTPPLICPSPSPPAPGDCGLFHQRAVTADQQLRRAVLRDGGRRPSMAALVWADMEADRPTRREPGAPPTRPELPAPEPVIAPAFASKKGVLS